METYFFFINWLAPTVFVRAEKQSAQAGSNWFRVMALQIQVTGARHATSGAFDLGTFVRCTTVWVSALAVSRVF